MRAFQPYGDTKTKTPHWKTFRLDKFEEWTPLKKRHFNEPPQEQYNAEGKYNPNGDGSMSEVLIQADFTGSQKYQRGEGSYSGLKKHNDEVVNQKRKEEPFYDLKKNIEKSYNGNNIDYIKRNIDSWRHSDAAKEFKKPNSSSIYDMSQINDFGDDSVAQTVGPISKDNVEYKEKNEKKPNYSQAYKNGPVYQNDNEIENNNIENNNKDVKSDERNSSSSETND